LNGRAGNVRRNEIEWPVLDIDQTARETEIEAIMAKTVQFPM
jgi:hypothetical protein